MSHSNRKSCRTLLGAAAILLSASSAHRAAAQSSDVAIAESLFREGKERMAAKDYVRACPKFADSQRLDPATGTLLALAICHERAGKLASAWAEYADAAARAKRENRTDREKASRQRVAAIEPRLSYLTISAPRSPGEAQGVEITRNGVAVGTGTLGTAVPVDGGVYSIAASAPGKKPWRTQLTIAASGERLTVTVPALEEDEPATAPVARAAAKSAPAKTAQLAVAAPAPAAAETAPAPPAADVRAADPGRSAGGYGALGAAAIAGGIAGIGIGTIYVLRAVAKNEDSKNGCDGDRCSPAATQDRLDARAFGNVATIGFLAGGALLAAGTTLYLVGGPSKPTTSARTAASLEASPLVGPGALGGVLQGTF